MSLPDPSACVEWLRVGLVQTGVHPCAWQSGAKMSREEEEAAIAEIRTLMGAFQGPEAPDIILLPELAVPRGWERELRRLAERLGAVIVAGVDYAVGPAGVRNEAVVIVPSVWRDRRVGRGTVTRRIAKTYAAEAEQRGLKEVGLHFIQEPSVWVFDGGGFGSFGVALCYDFLDLERAAMYRKRIQHLFVLSFNRDSHSFNHMAEALARTVYTNVVVCNCGHFGGSLAVSPFREPPRRVIYRHDGPSLSTVQTFSLPVRELVEHQATGGKTFKGRPPGYTDEVLLALRNSSLE
ncbi:hypothetical protein [Sphingomonas adhaesiva]|uniref:hypothetical protein n=1 Tax=Sphingomonas adhaesiva TaxID=28212 RepID=UPI002FF98C85